MESFFRTKPSFYEIFLIFAATPRLWMTLNKQPTPFSGGHVENEIFINHASAFHILLSCQHLPNVTIILHTASISFIDGLVIPPFIAFAKLSRISSLEAWESCERRWSAGKLPLPTGKTTTLISIVQNRRGSWLERLNPSSSGTATGGFWGRIADSIKWRWVLPRLSVAVHSVLTSLYIISQFSPGRSYFTTMTTYVLYSPDGAIDEFFNSNTTVTRQQYDEFAISHASGVSTAL